MFTERTSVGLDVRSVAAAAIDGATDELIQAKLTSTRAHPVLVVSAGAGSCCTRRSSTP